MKKSFIFRSLQVTTAVSIYSAIYIWASNSHLGSVYSLLNGLDEFLLVLALAVIFPYVCFKGLSKLTTPPSSRNRDQPSKSTPVDANEDPLDDQQIEVDFRTMQYRGTSYHADGSENLEINTVVSNRLNITPKSVTKYRGVQIGDVNDGSASVDSNAEVNQSFAEERQQQKSARPKERIKYRGAYID